MKCQLCKKNKQLKSFNKNCSKLTGFQGYCKTCSKIAQKKWQNKNPARAKKSWAKRYDKFYSSIKGRATYMLIAARQRADKYNVKCSLTRSWIEKRLQN